MLTSHISLFVFLMKLILFFNGQQHVKSDVSVMATDTCALKNGQGTFRDDKKPSRAVAPSCAGREGIDNGKYENYRWIGLPVNDSSLYENYDFKNNVSFSIKFFLKPDQLTTDRRVFSYNTIALIQTVNDSFQLDYYLKNNTNAVKMIMFTDYGKNLFIEMPKTEMGEFNNCDLTNGDQSDWTQQIGMKVKVSQRKKRETPPGDQAKNYPWMMIGYDFRSNPDGHFHIYINGKIVHSENFTDKYSIWASTQYNGRLLLGDGKFSCVEFSKDRRDASYFTDLRLSECVKKYKGEPEKKYEDCEKEL